jgi:pimeloyl-ACP methyl ester carboxylesterase
MRRVVFRRVKAAVALAAVPLVVLLAPMQSGAGTFAIAATASAQTPCGDQTGVLCSEVVVPLDRRGVVPGSVTLKVEVVPTKGPSRGVVFLVAGGPGQGSAHVFGLEKAANVSLFRYLFPGYTIVAYDDRGTGDSGLLDCPDLQRADTAEAQRNAVTACAAVLGAGRDFYSTADHAEDMDAVRTALGYDKIAVYGVSYGTKLAMAYAYAHPGHVERLLLDSVLPPELPDPFGANVLRLFPATLAAFCSGGSCRQATHDFSGDVGVLANKLAAKPLRAVVSEPGGAKKQVEVDGLEILSMVIDGDLNAGLAAELPAVVNAALHGNTQPLARLAYLHDKGNAEKPADLSATLYAATVCRDGPFPWAADTPVGDRLAIEQAAIGKLSPNALGPFGLWAVQFGNADYCLGWPSPTGAVTLDSGPLPDVPVYAVSGGIDLRTPTAGAESVVARFPQGKLLVVPGIGHSTVTADYSGCAAKAVHTWMTGGAPPSQCPRVKALVAPVPALPVSRTHAASPAETLVIATKTLHEAQAAWLMTGGVTGSSASVPGIFGGRLKPTSDRTFTLAGYSVARGVALSGTIKVTRFAPPMEFQGILTVSGRGAAQGILGLTKGVLRGTLGSKVVG